MIFALKLHDIKRKKIILFVLLASESFLFNTQCKREKGVDFTSK